MKKISKILSSISVLAIVSSTIALPIYFINNDESNLKTNKLNSLTETIPVLTTSVAYLNGNTATVQFNIFDPDGIGILDPVDSNFDFNYSISENGIDYTTEVKLNSSQITAEQFDVTIPDLTKNYSVKTKLKWVSSTTSGYSESISNVLAFGEQEPVVVASVNSVFETSANIKFNSISNGNLIKKILISTDGATWDSITTIDPDENNYALTNLSPNTKITVRSKIEWDKFNDSSNLQTFDLPDIIFTTNPLEVPTFAPKIDSYSSGARIVYNKIDPNNLTTKVEYKLTDTSGNPISGHENYTDITLDGGSNVKSLHHIDSLPTSSSYHLDMKFTFNNTGTSSSTSFYEFNDLLFRTDPQIIPSISTTHNYDAAAEELNIESDIVDFSLLDFISEGTSMLKKDHSSSAGPADDTFKSQIMIQTDILSTTNSGANNGYNGTVLTIDMDSQLDRKNNSGAEVINFPTFDLSETPTGREVNYNVWINYKTSFAGAGMNQIVNNGNFQVIRNNTPPTVSVNSTSTEDVITITTDIQSQGNQPVSKITIKGYVGNQVINETVNTPVSGDNVVNITNSNIKPGDNYHAEVIVDYSGVGGSGKYSYFVEGSMDITQPTFGTPTYTVNGSSIDVDLKITDPSGVVSGTWQDVTINSTPGAVIDIPSNFMFSVPGYVAGSSKSILINLVSVLGSTTKKYSFIETFF